MYAGYSVDVEVTHQPQAPARVRLSSADHLRVALGRVRRQWANPGVRAALAAAAMIPLVAFLVLSSQTASATSVRGISKAVKRVDNLHVIQYGRDRSTLAYELLIADGRVGLKSPVEQTLYDVKTRRIEMRYTREGLIEDAPLERDEYADNQRLVDSILGFAMAGIPMDTELQRLPPQVVPNLEDGSEAYELTWEAKSVGEMVPRYRLRVFLDPVRRLPTRTETFWWTPDDPQWRLEATRLFEYPTAEAADIAIEGMFIRR
jgi:hypothetical protein